MNVISVWEDFINDSANTAENGEASFSMFNRLSRRTEGLLQNWLTGDVAGQQPPAPWLTQKDKDWLSPFITQFKAHAEGGIITRPDNYAAYDNLALIGSAGSSDCDEDEDAVPKEVCNTSVELLDGQQFDVRCNTYIEELKPSLSKPIAKMIGKTFVFAPKDVGSVQLEYIRYPAYAEIKSKKDVAFNILVPDPLTSINYEWDEAVRSILIYIITDLWTNSTREQAAKQFNEATGKQLK